MVVLGKNSRTHRKNLKRGSAKIGFVGALESGLNRRAFLRQSSIAVIFASIAACKPTTPTAAESNKPHASFLTNVYSIDPHQKKTIAAVQMQLFPDDGDGPSASDINALEYLEWAMTDTNNEADGDPEFILKGIGWLDGLSEQTKGSPFIQLKNDQQDQVLRQISQSGAGENWLSLLIYYLTEALVFDPIYGGNTDSIGWKWLKHQPGFPRPTEATIYRKFDYQ